MEPSGLSPVTGSKRKANEPLQPVLPKRIKQLDPDVVNKIAAGEIIVAAMHALKELIENSVDAGATSIDVIAKEGGLKLLQITDNGHGIEKDDLPILCERFTTSKLKAFEDLSSIATYGFRGEALASISHIAHLTITTKTANSSCAWKAAYQSGKLVPLKAGQSADPKPSAGRQGTQITVENLFYNTPQRLRAFRSPSEEYAKIIDVVGRYGVHCSHVSFTCKKFGEAASSIAITATTSTKERIRQIHGSNIANELLTFQVTNDNLGFKASGYTTSANYHGKKMTLLLFINHRSVESSAVKAAVQRLYHVFLPKNGFPFTYIDLEIDPHRVDVNVHPTKREVNFLNEEEIIDLICDTITAELSKVDVSRTFKTQTLLQNTSSTTMSAGRPSTSGPAKFGKTPSGTSAAPNALNRVDPSMRKITVMFNNAKDQAVSTPEISYDMDDRAFTNIRLATIKELREEVRDDTHQILTETFANLVFVGVVDFQRRIVAMQSGIKLFLVDYGLVCNEYFYQLGLTDFANFGVIRFTEQHAIKDLVQIAVDFESRKTGNDLSGTAEKVVNILVEKREMLLEYFSMGISEDGKLLSLPLLVKGYIPSMGKLPEFLLRLGPCVDWDDEKECFKSFLLELAAFYTPETLLDGPSPEGGEVQMDDSDRNKENDSPMLDRKKQLRHVLEHVLFPALRSRLVATKGLLTGVVEVANLRGLYKVFERC